MWVPAKLALLAERHRRAFVHHVARRQLVAAHRRVREQRAGAAFDVDPAVGARRAGVARDRVELLLALVQVLGQRLQARRALLEVERQQRRHAGAARVAPAPRRSRSRRRARDGSPRRRSRWPARRRRALPIQRPAIRLCRMAHGDLIGWYFQAPFSILTITRARWSRPRWSVGVMLKMPCAPALRASPRARRAARRGIPRVPGCAFFSATRRGGRHQLAGVPGVGAEGRDRALAVGRLVLGDVFERARPAPGWWPAAARRPAPGRPAGRCLRRPCRRRAGSRCWRRRASGSTCRRSRAP